MPRHTAAPAPEHVCTHTQKDSRPSFVGMMMKKSAFEIRWSECDLYNIVRQTEGTIKAMPSFPAGGLGRIVAGGRTQGARRHKAPDAHE